MTGGPEANINPKGVRTLHEEFRKFNLFKFADIKIIYRNKHQFAEMKKVNCSEDVVEVLRTIWSDKLIAEMNSELFA